MEKWLNKTSTLSQVAQILTDLEHFEAACPELETSVTTLRSVWTISTNEGWAFIHIFPNSSNQRGGVVRITAASSFSKTLEHAIARISTIINSKLDDFFELSEYNWTPKNREDTPSMYLYELINWLTTVVDSLAVKDTYKDEAYKGAAQYIADCFMVRISESFILVVSDRQFWIISGLPRGKEYPDGQRKCYLEYSYRCRFYWSWVQTDRPRSPLYNIYRTASCKLTLYLSVKGNTDFHVKTASIPLLDVVQEYLVPGVRQASYSVVKPKKLQALLEKLAKYCASIRDAGIREKGERRRKEAEAVGHIYPGEHRWYQCTLQHIYIWMKEIIWHIFRR